MSAELEGLSSWARLQASEALAGRLLVGGIACPECPDYIILPQACERRAVEWLLSGRLRPHICQGESCPHWREAFTERAAAERADRPRCAQCGEPIEGHAWARFCPDCQAERRSERRAAERLARNAAAVAETGAVQKVHAQRSKAVQCEVTEASHVAEEKGFMKQTQAAAALTQEGRLLLVADRYPNHPPLPDGGRISTTGKVWVGTNEKKPCPRCRERWINVRSNGVCRECDAPDHMAKMRQTLAAKTVVGAIPPAKIRQKGLDLLAEKGQFTAAENETMARAFSAEIRRRAARSALATVPPATEVEAMAQALAAQVRRRAAEILGLEAQP